MTIRVITPEWGLLGVRGAISLVTAAEVKSFIESYSSEEKERIAFLWNGKHAEELADSNFELRNAVIDAIANHNTEASTALISDLFDEETSFSVEAWGAVDELLPLAEKLLLQGGTDSVLTFIRCKWKSFDTEMACAGIEIPESLRLELQEFCRYKAGTAGSDAAQYALGAQYFASLA